MVLFSGGVKQDDDAAVLRKVALYMDAGATGVMFGRNMWLRPFDQAARPHAPGASHPEPASARWKGT
jgi:class I fructose-bisphosphate aldolase